VSIGGTYLGIASSRSTVLAVLGELLFLFARPAILRLPNWEGIIGVSDSRVRVRRVPFPENYIGFERTLIGVFHQ